MKMMNVDDIVIKTSEIHSVSCTAESRRFCGRRRPEMKDGGEAPEPRQAINGKSVFASVALTEGTEVGAIVR